MARKALTDRFVDSVTVEKRENFFDEKAAGLCLRVTPSGAKSWSFVYRMRGKLPQWLALGSYPAVTLSRARGEALKHRAAVEIEKRDPVAEAKAALLPPNPPSKDFTFADMAKIYLAFAKDTKKTWYD